MHGSTSGAAARAVRSVTGVASCKRKFNFSNSSSAKVTTSFYLLHLAPCVPQDWAWVLQVPRVLRVVWADEDASWFGQRATEASVRLEEMPNRTSPLVFFRRLRCWHCLWSMVPETRVFFLFGTFVLSPWCCPSRLRTPKTFRGA